MAGYGVVGLSISWDKKREIGQVNYTWKRRDGEVWQGQVTTPNIIVRAAASSLECTHGGQKTRK
jgi:hypothetical protein